MTPPLAYSASQLAELLGVSEWTIYRQAKAGRIPSLLIGSRRVFPRAAVDTWLAEQAAASVEVGA